LVSDHAVITTFLFTDIEGSTRLWEQEPERMRPALARHDALARSAVENHRGVVVKMTGDGIHAAFDDPLDAIQATLELQRALADPGAPPVMELRVRCGLHAGVVEERDNDAHGGQTLLSRAVAELINGRLPAGVALRDLGAVRLRDLAAPEHVFQVEHPELRKDFPPLRSLEETPNNLPHEVTSFIGRERELQEVVGILAHKRVVTLVGMGGLGKTRLSLHVAAEAMDEFPDGVWFVELAPLRDARLVAQAVASTLGVKEEAGQPVIEGLERYVKDRRVLLVLDNCEHLLHGCAEVAAKLLRSAPHLKILASSREPLRIAGEACFPVSALEVPNLRVPFEPHVLAQFGAVQLFVERAVAAVPTFALDKHNATAIAAICHRLDGIPLALELAAARVRSLPVDTIAERLTDRFKLLRGGDQTALPRQQTLRALIDWSFDLLSNAERSLLRQLSVFAGGWTLEAAEAVCACEAEDVLDLLGRLVEKSLVMLDAQGRRYRLLETVRQYAQERLDESDDAARARDHHLAFYVAFAEIAQPGLSGPGAAKWLAALDLELENVLAAHAWAIQKSENAQRSLRLVNLVKRYWFHRGLLELGLRVTLEALSQPGARQRNIERCHGLFTAGQLRHLMGKYGEARKCLDESVAIARELGEARSIIAVLQSLGMAAQGEGDLATARAYLEEALTLAQRGGDERRIAAATNALAQFECADGKWQAAEPLFEKVVALSRETGDREVVAIGLLNLAIVSISRGLGERALPMLGETVAIAEEIGSSRVEQSLLEVTAGFASQRGDTERAARFYGAAEAQARKTGLRRDPTDEAFLAPLMARARELRGAAAFDAAASAGFALSPREAVTEVRDWLLRSPA
jgi:predicted ATPase